MPSKRREDTEPSARGLFVMTTKGPWLVDHVGCSSYADYPARKRDTPMSDPVAAVTETEASGETAAIFIDIRSVYGVSVVNLIWRHLATFPGALPWAWGTVRPLYAGGAIAREAAGLRAARRLPSLPPVPREVFTAMGLTRDDLRQIGVVLDAYERTNPMALVALSVLRQSLAAPASIDGGAETRTPRTEESDPEPRLPPLPPLLYQGAKTMTHGWPPP